MNEPATETYAVNLNTDVWCGRIEDFTAALETCQIELPQVSVVIGGPPCQGFSPLGKMSASRARQRKHDEMNELWRYFVRVVELLNPHVLVTENVPEFLRSEEFEHYCRAIAGLGYIVQAAVLRAEEFGVPQKRRRAFTIGSRSGPPAMPLPTGERVTVREAIGHLPGHPDDVNWHIGRNPTAKSLERYRCIPPGGNRFDLMRERPDITPQCWLRKPTGTTDVFGRLEWDGLACTIRTEFYKPEKGCYLHPEEDRPITHREAACLQSFPDEFDFIGSKVQVARQIGEAVPPKLAYEVANAVLRSMTTIEGEHDAEEAMVGAAASGDR
jgi:DNA (cytosine-5)-methyltransferase 1